MKKREKASGTPGPAKRGAPAPRPTPNFAPPLVSAALALVTLAVFWPVTRHEFVNLDDQVYITTNARVQAGLTAANVAWAFHNLQAGFWQPLTWLSHMLDCQLFGLRAGGHHRTSLLLHVANSLLVLAVLRRFTGALWRSAFIAGLFALHPLQVEPVAWAASRKDVLSTFFGLLALWAYAKYAGSLKSKVQSPKSDAAHSAIRNPQSALEGSGLAAPKSDGGGSRITHHASPWYLLSLVFFAFGLMSKTMLVSWPLLLLLLDWWPLRRLQKATLARPLLEKVPFLVLAIVAGVLTLHAEHGVGALPDAAQYPLQFRAANAVLSCAGYLAQFLWPAGLAVFYPYPSVFSALKVVGGAGLVAVLSALALRTYRTRPYVAMGWCWYLVTVLPVLGLIQVGAHAHADRYCYVPLVGIFVLLTWGACDLAKAGRAHPAVLPLAGAGCLIAFGAVTTEQLACWKNSDTLFRHALEVTRDNYVAHYCLGDYLCDQGNNAEGIAEYRLALQINPAYAEANNNLGVELMMRGDTTEGVKCFQSAIRFNPRLASAYSNLAMALVRQGKKGEALEQYQQSLQLKPEDARVQSNYANLLAEQGRVEEALTHFTVALRLAPNLPEIHFSLGRTLATQSKRAEAVAQFQEALRLRPDYAPALNAQRALEASPGR